jgi:antitoxin component YwqK of YwqJK toxin-antitoxin module
VNEYWDDGSLKKVVTEEPYLGTGKLILLKYYTKGSKDTAKYYNVKRYYVSGQIESSGEILNGVKNGLWKYWYEDGKKALEENYVNGRKSGKFKSWFPDGTILEEGEY